ncbi:MULTISPECIES: hypothetical protein [Brevibacillus]|uniref:hypothetical protein n=1 Tax=Brevibacillus TaxID=55080 RepID=UPI00031FCE0B|nr:MULTISPECIES: hypothetical protein [Brevibacillus]MDN4092836.1 hypothetical protein [Brevibacillus agri]MDR9507369.1 hypothetical protein [Brevibacillus agri]MED1824683.1 hypothetical protein [Brevibacillus agri]MED3501341.1 hypothetical protein [Brevibacillus agri]
MKASRADRIVCRQFFQQSVPDRFAQGETPQLNGLERADEIGKLSRSLDYMMRQIQHKEEALMAENERYLEKKNRFVLALTSTWDKGSFCRALFRTP